MSSPARRLASLAVLLVLAGGGCRAEPASTKPFPGMQLQARLETHLQNQRTALRETLEHYALIFDDVSQQDLKAYLRPVQFFGLGDSFVLGTQQGFEPHGGGLLRLIWTWWRPDSRAAQPGDRFWFEPNRAGLELGRIYRGHQRQIFLPVPGKVPDEVRGEIPQSGQLPRMRFAGPSWPTSAVEVDSYHFLALLMDRQQDYRETWTNQLGQQLSTDLLLQNAWDFYLASPVADLEPDDHSALHLVEILLEFNRRREQGGAAPARRLDPNAIKRRFLAIELARDTFPEDDETLLLGHYVESLGYLLADPHVEWSADERKRVRDWLGALERDRFRDLGAVKPRRLSHLLLGLRLIAEHRAELE
jgi:hypothetical protein